MKIKITRTISLSLALIGLTLSCALPLVANFNRAQAADEAQSDTAAMNCPKCKGAMEAGVILDYWENQFRTSEWAAGDPKWHVFGTMPHQKKITVYRCTSCGYLESYAK